MTTTPDLTLTTSRIIAAPVERVFDAWLDPAMLQRFMIASHGSSVPTATSHAVVGGRFDLIMKVGDRELPHGGIYKVIDRPRRIVFEWQSPFSVPGNEVTIDFAEGSDGTEVTLTQVRFASEESCDNHRGGWAMILESLGKVMDSA